jgi:hypothetical protein
MGLVDVRQAAGAALAALPMARQITLGGKARIPLSRADDHAAEEGRVIRQRSRSAA